MICSIADIYQETGFIFQIQVGYIIRSENNILISSSEDDASAIPVHCTFHHAV